MKKILVLIFFAQTVYAARAPDSLQGEYTLYSGVRTSSSEEYCNSQGGIYTADDQSCFIQNAGEPNTISIGAQYVRIESVWGGGTQISSYNGKIIKVAGNTIDTKRGRCAIAIQIDSSMKASAVLSPNCDPTLSIVGAEKVK